MNLYFMAAAILLTLVGVAHSVLGERWIFRRLRSGTLIPTLGGALLREPHVRILWASWHLVTILGACLAWCLAWLALPHNLPMMHSALPIAIGAAVLAGAVLVYVATNGKHLGWAGLLGVAILVGCGVLP